MNLLFYFLGIHMLIFDILIKLIVLLSCRFDMFFFYFCSKIFKP
jgi:hypothetical protein